jgi:metal-dependent amidase/aminoacylase/carboxypeptidase family protein
MATPIDELDSDLLGQLTEFRRDLHSHPELGFQETRTAARVAAALRAHRDEYGAPRCAAAQQRREKPGREVLGRMGACR